MGTINLARGQYAKETEKGWSLGSFFAGKTSDRYRADLRNAKSITILSPVATPLVDYTLSGDNRYGTRSEVEDEIQTLEMKMDKSWTKTIDASRFYDQRGLENVAEYLMLQRDEVEIPSYDKHAFKKFAINAGKSVVKAQVSASNILGFILLARTAMLKAPITNRYLYLSSTNCNFIRETTPFQSVEALAVKNLEKGVIGTVYGYWVVEMPDDYVLTGVQFLAMQKDAGIAPRNIDFSRAHENPVGIHGWLMEHRQYFDAFVIGRKAADGIYACILAALKVAAPIVTATGASHEITAVTGVVFRYTLDNSDPRYSGTAITYTGAVTLPAGSTIALGKPMKSCGEKADMCLSDVTTTEYVG